MRRFLLLIANTLLLAALLPPALDAHALGVACKLNGDRVVVEAYFDDDTPARAADVRVKDASGQVVAEGRTDADGRWSFPRPQPGTYRVVIDAGAGHRTRTDLTVPGDGESSAADGPGRQEFTRTPWLQLVFGLMVIAGLALVLWTVLQRRRHRG